MTQWEPIETAPTTTEDVLVYSYGDVSVAYKPTPKSECYVCLADGFSAYTQASLTTSSDRVEVKPTHWMPLPNPPENT